MDVVGSDHVPLAVDAPLFEVHGLRVRVPVSSAPSSIRFAHLMASCIFTDQLTLPSFTPSARLSIPAASTTYLHRSRHSSAQCRSSTSVLIQSTNSESSGQWDAVWICMMVLSAGANIDPARTFTVPRWLSGMLAVRRGISADLSC